MPAAPLFSPAAFDLLAGLRRDPRAGFYHAHREALKAEIELPMRALMAAAAARFAPAVTARLETRRNLCSRFLKNDFGAGGAWDHYWAAFYPLGSRRVSDLQLAVWIEADLLQVSLYVSEPARARRALLLRSCARHYWDLLAVLPGLFEGENLLLSSSWDLTRTPDGRITAAQPLGWAEWLKDPARGLFCLRTAWTRAEALRLTAGELTEKVARLHQAYFPLVLACLEENPLPEITAFLG